ncbi:hypothetical protein H696_01781 [Fonticula alba]|uniref:Uncharacterized protein n=1 Tax=Fonticula alba TaxID=691883 RepID=A0A058ZEL0_FONAL|nr:hypothetical protein H696_01781 [Fonticula alba]KCV72386.1 hypothetical protein H696_01781 [Fonticula alba]|eukprot:XP_009493964.1 hypothetical protein H696_01781 [Fonticula alba]
MQRSGAGSVGDTGTEDPRPGAAKSESGGEIWKPGSRSAGPAVWREPESGSGLESDSMSDPDPDPSPPVLRPTRGRFRRSSSITGDCEGALARRMASGPGRWALGAGEPRSNCMGDRCSCCRYWLTAVCCRSMSSRSSISVSVPLGPGGGLGPAGWSPLAALLATGDAGSPSGGCSDAALC